MWCMRTQLIPRRASRAASRLGLLMRRETALESDVGGPESHRPRIVLELPVLGPDEPVSPSRPVQPARNVRRVRG